VTPVVKRRRQALCSQPSNWRKIFSRQDKRDQEAAEKLVVEKLDAEHGTRGSTMNTAEKPTAKAAEPEDHTAERAAPTAETQLELTVGPAYISKTSMLRHGPAMSAEK
jgi:hypothetical protein